jgi:drug/metabolite transporter (DMT)-like permease
MQAFLFILVAAIWGSAFLGIKVAVTIMPPFLAASLRVFFAALIGLALVLWKGLGWPVAAQAKKSMILGMTGMGIPWIMLFWGQRYIYPALGAILNSTVPIFVIVFSTFLLRGKGETSPSKIFGVICGFLGVLVIFYPELHFSESGGVATIFTEHLKGMIALMGMAIVYGLNIVLMKRWAVQVHHYTNLLLQTIGAFAVLFPLTLLFEIHQWPHWDHPGLLKGLGSIFYLSAFCTALSLIIFFDLLERMGAVRAGAITFLIPITAVVIDWVAYQKLPSWNQILGALLIIGGLVMINFRQLFMTNKNLSAAA